MVATRVMNSVRKFFGTAKVTKDDSKNVESKNVESKNVESKKSKAKIIASSPSPIITTNKTDTNTQFEQDKPTGRALPIIREAHPLKVQVAQEAARNDSRIAAIYTFLGYPDPDYDDEIGTEIVTECIYIAPSYFVPIPPADYKTDEDLEKVAKPEHKIKKLAISPQLDLAKKKIDEIKKKIEEVDQKMEELKKAAAGNNSVSSAAPPPPPTPPPIDGLFLNVSKKPSLENNQIELIKKALNSENLKSKEESQEPLNLKRQQAINRANFFLDDNDFQRTEF